MKNKLFFVAMCAFTLVLQSGCSEPQVEKKQTASADVEVTVGKFAQTQLENGEASHITVQHVLIAFKGSVPEENVTRTKEEAEKLAEEVLAKAKAGEEFDGLVRIYTDDKGSGIYHMANYGQESDMTNLIPDNRVYPREGMVGAFGNVGFPLEVGEVGMASYDPKESKYGWHIIKRIQ